MIRSAVVALLFLVMFNLQGWAEESPELPVQQSSAEFVHAASSSAEHAEEGAPQVEASSHESEGEAAHQESGHAITHMMMLLILQLAVIVIVAKLGGYLFQRFLKMPSVLGELTSGMIIGPYALGSKIMFPSLGILFAEQSNGFAASEELYGIATLASIILLFLAGLETDLAAFLRYSVVGSVVGLGGLITAFVLGDLCAVLWPNNGIHSFMDPAALFLGVISVATSVGITAPNSCGKAEDGLGGGGYDSGRRGF